MTDERHGSTGEKGTLAFNVLEEPFIRVEMKGGVRAALTLPEVCGALAADRVGTFPGLRGHQTHAWHAFLVQLAAMGLEALGEAEPPGDDAAGWATVLRTLTADWPGDEPWCLVSPPTVPALLQAPIPEAESSLFEKQFKNLALTPDGLDMLVTSKNHDMKAARMRKAQPDDWLFALVSLQTQGGYSGGGGTLFGIARMNGGFGNRTYVSFSPVNATAGEKFRHDLSSLQSAGNELHDTAQEIGLATEEAIALLWTIPWNGETSIPISRLHPLFVEICRRVRLDLWNGRLRARVGGSGGRLVDAKDLAGNLADPWTPIEKSDEPKALSVTREGFSYRRMSDLLFGSPTRSWRLPVLARPRGTGPMQMVAAGIARGEGKTEGVHQRAMDIPGRAMTLLETDSGWIATRAHERIRVIDTVQKKCLWPALKILLVEKGVAKTDENKKPKIPTRVSKIIDPWIGRLDREVNTVFFVELWDSLDCEDDDEAAGRWERTLAGLARRILEAACEAAPRTDDRRIMARARAGNLLESALKKHLTSLTPPREEPEDAA